MSFEDLLVSEHAFDVDDDARAPLLITLHGRGGTPAPPDRSRVRGPHRLLVPRGPYSVGAGFGWSPISVTEKRPRELATDIAESADRLAALLERARDRTLGRAIVVGYSQGAITGLALALRRPDLVSTAVLGAAWLPPLLEPASIGEPSVRVRAYHGDADPIVPLEESRTLMERLLALGLDVELRVFEGVDHTASPEMGVLAAYWIGEAVEGVREGSS